MKCLWTTSTSCSFDGFGTASTYRSISRSKYNGDTHSAKTIFYGRQL